MTRAPSDDRAVTAPQMARPRVVDERVWRKADSPGQGHHGDLDHQHGLPGCGLAGMDGRDVPEAGDDEHGVGGPLDAAEGPGQRPWAPPLPGRGPWGRARRW